MEYAAGGLISNTEDLLKWHRGLYLYRILKKETLQKAFTPFVLKDGTSTGYGYGWFQKTSNGIRSLEHERGLPGFLSNEIYFPSEDVFIAILCNSLSAPLAELSIKISTIALRKPLQADLTMDAKLLDQYVGVYVLSADTSKTMTLVKEGNRLVAKVSETIKIPLLFASDTRFQFQYLLDAHCEFVKENGKVTKFDVDQNGHYEWLRQKLTE
jgi:CubicO group peptidase (beta-lactamase class C family)